MAEQDLAAKFREAKTWPRPERILRVFVSAFIAFVACAQLGLLVRLWNESITWGEAFRVLSVHVGDLVFGVLFSVIAVFIDFVSLNITYVWVRRPEIYELERNKRILLCATTLFVIFCATFGVTKVFLILLIFHMYLLFIGILAYASSISKNCRYMSPIVFAAVMAAPLSVLRKEPVDNFNCGPKTEVRIRGGEPLDCRSISAFRFRRFAVVRFQSSTKVFDLQDVTGDYVDPSTGNELRFLGGERFPSATNKSRGEGQPAGDVKDAKIRS